MSFLAWTVAEMVERCSLQPEAALRQLWHGKLLSDFAEVASFETMRTLLKRGRNDRRTALLIKRSFPKAAQVMFR